MRFRGDNPEDLARARTASGTAPPPDGPDIVGDLEFLGHHWGSAYLIGREGGRYTAVRRDGNGDTLTDPERDGLRRKIAADYAASPVPRDLP